MGTRTGGGGRVRFNIAPGLTGTGAEESRMTIADRLTRDLYTEICRIPLLDPHSHINPHRAASRTLDDILGYHYYTELAHSAGMGQAPLGQDVAPRARVQAILEHMDRLDNTVQ